MNGCSSVQERDAPDIEGADRLPLAREELRLEKRAVETGKVRVRTVVEEEPVTLRDSVVRQEAIVERIPIGRPVERAPEIREEGEVLIIPVLEERLVAVKQLFLVEEVRVRRALSTAPVEIAATRRIMRAEIEREPIQSPTPEEDR